jgi:lipid II:glycine glycyltransferase (peptidoglycan interpeptide bridge formation enzyme)
MTESLVLKRVSSARWNELVPDFRDLSYRQCSSYAEQAARRVGAAFELNCILTQGGELIGLAEVRVKSAPMTPWGIAYTNYAPMVMREGRFSERDFGRCVDALREEYVGRRRFVLRIVPPPSGGFFQKVQAHCLEASGFRPGLSQARKTLLLDLAISPDEIRRNLDPKWRGSLVRAEKNGIGITRSAELQDFERFNHLFLECTERKRFMPDQDVEFFKRVQTRTPASQKMILHLAWDRGELIAGHLGSYIGDTAVYLLGAANLRGRNLLASFLLQWHAIIHAQRIGSRFYDLGGVDEQGNPGVFRFKRRLNGRPLTELVPHELAPDPLSRGVVRFAEAARSAVKHGALPNFNKS